MHSSFENEHTIPFPKGGTRKILRFYAYFKISGTTAGVQGVPNLGKVLWSAIINCWLLTLYWLCVLLSCLSHADTSGIFSTAIYAVCLTMCPERKKYSCCYWWWRPSTSIVVGRCSLYMYYLHQDQALHLSPAKEP